MPVTAREWVAAAARYHDPAARWPAFSADIEIVSSLDRGGSYTNQVLLDRARDTFRRQAAAGRYNLLQSVGPDEMCMAAYDDPDATPGELARLGIGIPDPCTAIAWRRDFYDFLIGLPMSGLTAEASLDFGPGVSTERGDTNVFGETAVAVRLTYPGRPSEPTWWLYVSPTDYRLVAARFRMPAGGGEWLHYPNDVHFDGFRLKAQQAWYRLDGTPVVTDVLEYMSLGD